MAADDDLEPLVDRARAGDTAALDELLVRLQPLVLRRCARFLPHRMDAEEAAQDALLAVPRGLDRFYLIVLPSDRRYMPA